jgi:hypothetical protein
MQRGQALQILRGDGRLCLRALLLALLGVLVLAASAQADEFWTESPSPESQQAPATGQEAQPSEPLPQDEAPANETPASESPASQGGSEAPQGEAPPSEQGTGSSSETAETPASEAPVEQESAPPTETPAVTPEPESPPVAAQPAETPEEAQPATPSSGAEEPTHAKAGAVEDSEETGASGGGSSARSASVTTTTTEPIAQDTTRIATAAVQDPPTGPPATITAQIAELAASEAQSGGKHVATASKQAGRFGCELAALSGDMTDNCTVGWLGSTHELTSSISTSPAIAAVSSLALAGSTPNGPAGGEHDGFVVSGPPMTPAPGPAPSGASGAATGGGSGAGVSIFLTLAGLLLLGAPRAMRRFRLSYEPWLAGCFVLIPERPD